MNKDEELFVRRMSDFEPIVIGVPADEIPLDVVASGDVVKFQVNGTSEGQAMADTQQNVEQNGAMIALVPCDADARRIVVSGGEALDQLHLTLFFLGDADLIDPEMRSELIMAVTRAVTGEECIMANGFSVNVFNPLGEEPCIVLGVGGDELDDIREDVEDGLEEVEFALPEQNCPWIPHVTLQYTNDFSKVADLLARCGPIMFDRVRIAFANEVTDIPLEMTEEDEVMPDYSGVVTTFGAVASHTTATSNDSWDGPAAEKQLPSPVPMDTARNFYAWIDDSQESNGAIPKSAGKFGHHNVSGGKPGAANIKACQTGIGVLHGGRGGTTIPDADVRGVYDHLAKHIRDAGLEPPPFSLIEDELAAKKKKNCEGDVVDLSMAVKAPPMSGGPMMPGGGPMMPGYTDMAQMNGTPWQGILVVEGIETGDGRQFSLNSITWADLPLPLKWQPAQGEGHDGSVVVGRIDQIWRDASNPAKIMGSGVFDDQGTNGAEALRLVQGGFLKGISVDPDSIKDSDVELVFPEGGGDAPEDDIMSMFMAPELTIFHAGRLRAATLVDIPAFAEAQIWITSTPGTTTQPDAQVAAAHFSGLSNSTWVGAVQEKRLPTRMTLGVARSAFAHVGIDPKQGARFLHHEIGTDGHVGQANMTACATAINAINAGRAVTLSESERHAAYVHLAQHLRAGGLTPPPYSGEVITASGEQLERPPREWFDNPNFSELTPFTITDDGRVFGHGAAWQTCHTGFADACITAPHEPYADHAYFRLGEVVCAGGERVAVGTITLGTGHASVRGLTPTQAAEHYDNTGTAVAFVASGEDKHGIWVAGALRPGLSQARINELRAATLSGDWRRIGGALRLVAFLAVNHPGFPVPRTSTFVSQQKQLSLVAAGVISPDARTVMRSDAAVKLALGRIARGIGRDPQSKLAALRRRVHPEG